MLYCPNLKETAELKAHFMFQVSCKNEIPLKFSCLLYCQYLLYLGCPHCHLNVQNTLQTFHLIEKFLMVLVQQPSYSCSACNVKKKHSFCFFVSWSKTNKNPCFMKQFFGLLPQLHLTTCIAHTHFLLRFKELCSMCAWILSF